MAETAPRAFEENMTDWPEVCIIVLNWNNYEDTAACLESLKGVEYPNYRVIVVDNGSTDGSADRLQDEHGWCEFIFNKINRGFPGGVNVGIRAAQNDDVDYVLLLNNDAVIDANALQKMVSVGESSDDVGIISSKILYYDENIIHDAGRKFNFRTLEHENPHKGKPESSLTGTHEVEGISGCCMMIKGEVIDHIGILNEELFFFGGEDVDYCLRARDSGWRIIVQLDAPVRHKINSTAGSDSVFMEYHRVRNKLWTGYAHGGTEGKLGLIRRFMRHIRRIAALLLNGEKSRPLAVLRSYADFVSGIVSQGRKRQPSKEELLDHKNR